MSRKNLSRTVIEGGRRHANRYRRRESHVTERATTRQWLDRVSVDVEEAEASVAPRRQPVPRQFHDKLGPALRWLLAQVGRPWSKVHAELCARFDTRTIAGRHVLHDHMLEWVRPHDERRAYWSRWDLVVDTQGILRKPRWFGRSYAKLRRKVRKFAAGRVCALTHKGWWWFRAVPDGPSCSLRSFICGRTRHHEIAGSRYHAVKHVGDRPVTRGELRYMQRLPIELRDELVIVSPWSRRVAR